jgi:4-oxalocrotonate tautomerase
MPIINVSVTGKPNPALSQKIAQDVTELTKLHLHKDPTVTAVAVTYIDPEHWFVGGKPLASGSASTFWLDIKVTLGTNTKRELANYLEAVFVAVSASLGETHEESYVMVHEVPAPAWGFAGKTQEFRFISGKLKTA